MNAIDFTSPTWKGIKEHLKTRLEQQRERNDSAKLDSVTTAHIRGRIAELKDLIALQDQPD